jgi:Tol biopolymer transport system component
MITSAGPALIVLQVRPGHSESKHMESEHGIPLHGEVTRASWSESRRGGPCRRAEACRFTFRARGTCAGYPRIGASVAVLLFATINEAYALPQAISLVSQSFIGSYSNGPSTFSSISADRTHVVFDSASSDIVLMDTNGARDVFVRHYPSGSTERVSVSSSGAQGNHHSAVPVITPNGRFVAFRSRASNLVGGDTNAREDVFLRDRLAGTTIRCSVSNAGIQADQDCINVSMSADGRYVAFESAASNLVPGDMNGVSDIFARDVLLGLTVAVSITPTGATGSSGSRLPSISGDGRFVAFQSSAHDLVTGDVNGVSDIFVRDLWLGATQLVSINAMGEQANAACAAPSISGNGRRVAFESAATNLVPGDVNAWTDVFVRDLYAHTTQLVSIASDGSQGDFVSGIDCCSSIPASPLSYDGRVVAFCSVASNLAGVDLDPFLWDVFTHDLLTGITRQISTGQAALTSSAFPAISADGRWVTFSTPDNTLLPPDTNGWDDVFLVDLGPAPFFEHCFGDGSGGACPCGNAGLPGRGCQNSRGTGGGVLVASGGSSLSADTLSVSFTGGGQSAFVVLLQGSETEAATPFADGLRCIGGVIKRIQSRTAAGGFALFPELGEPSISTRSAFAGDPIPIGATRHYQAYYRDADPTFCPAGGTANSSQAVAVLWEP